MNFRGQIKILFKVQYKFFNCDITVFLNLRHWNSLETAERKIIDIKSIKNVVS